MDVNYFKDVCSNSLSKGWLTRDGGFSIADGEKIAKIECHVEK
ncbi:hypothetical protein [Roseiconus lacunae]|nr:hypothetical protein [Roseiconus lacunae]